MDQTVPARSLAFPELPQSAMVSPVYHFAQFSSRVRSNRNARRAAEVSAPYALHVWLACLIRSVLFLSWSNVQREHGATVSLKARFKQKKTPSMQAETHGALLKAASSASVKCRVLVLGTAEVGLGLGPDSFMHAAPGSTFCGAARVSP